MARLSYLDLLRAVFSRRAKPTVPRLCPAPDAGGHTLVDLIGQPRTKTRGEAKGHRPWQQITGICLHQTAADFGTDPRRLLNVPVHGGTLRDGQIVLLHAPTDIMWAAGGLNRRDIHIEVSCRAAGIEGDERTLWRPKSDPDRPAQEATDIQLSATRRLVQRYVEQVAQQGGQIAYIHAHRQSSSQRTSDPGSRIWKAVGEWARQELGLSAGPPHWQTRDGKPLPDAWTGQDNQIPYNWRVDGFAS